MIPLKAVVIDNSDYINKLSDPCAKNGIVSLTKSINDINKGIALIKDEKPDIVFLCLSLSYDDINRFKEIVIENGFQNSVKFIIVSDNVPKDLTKSLSAIPLKKTQDIFDFDKAIKKIVFDIVFIGYPKKIENDEDNAYDPIRVEKEFKGIKNAYNTIKRNKLNKVQFRIKCYTNPCHNEIKKQLLNHRNTVIVHFSAHNQIEYKKISELNSKIPDKIEGLQKLDESVESISYLKVLLSDINKFFDNPIKLIVFNVCNTLSHFSDNEDLSYVVCMDGEIKGNSCVDFSEGFYLHFFNELKIIESFIRGIQGIPIDPRSNVNPQNTIPNILFNGNPI